MSDSNTLLDPAKVTMAPERAKSLAITFLAIAGTGAVLTLVNTTIFPLQQVMFSYLFAFYFAFTLSLGTLFWTMIHHLTVAGWSVVIRRIHENFSRAVWVLAPLYLPILIYGVWGGGLYEWAAIWNSEQGLAQLHSPYQESKFWGYLNQTFFTIRFLFYIAVWSALIWYFTTKSAEQDKTGDPMLSSKMQWLAAPGVLILALTATFMGFDWIMSLDYVWFSTMFGVYTWANCIRSALASVTITVLLLYWAGYLKGVVTPEHFHDMGKFLFAFTVFWAYIGYSQYFLQWYANLPEETRWWYRRGSTGLGEHAGWMYVTMGLAIGHFIIPFLFLLAREIKRNPVTLFIAACWILTFHMVDVFFQIKPTYYTYGPWANSPSDLGGADFFGGIWTDLSALAMMVGTVGAVVSWGFMNYPLVAIRDPRLKESLEFQNNEA